METLKSRFTTLDTGRSNKLERARESAKLTIPQLLPEYGWRESQRIEPTYSSVAARGVVNLASRMTSALFPVSNVSIFDFEMVDGSTLTDVDAIEDKDDVIRSVMRQLRVSNLRQQLFLLCQHLQVCGDALLKIEDDYSFQVFRLDQYVVRRDPGGNVVETILKEWVDPATLGVAPGTDGHIAPDSQVKEDRFEEMYTQVMWSHERNQWEVYREFRGTKEYVGFYEVNPYVALRWSAVANEDHGRSYCEELQGDLLALEGLTKALVEGHAAASRFMILVRPDGFTDIDDIDDSQNGQIISGRGEDIQGFSVDLRLQLETNFNAVEALRRDVGRAFLMTSSIQRSGERVTATEWRAMAGELEEVLGGIFSALSRDILRPVVRRYLTLMERDGIISSDLMATLGPIADIRITTGLDSIGRDLERGALIELMQIAASAPPEAGSTIKWPNWMKLLVTKSGFDADLLVKSPEDMQAEAQAAQEAALAQQAQGQMIQSAGAIAEQSAMQPPA